MEYIAVILIAAAVFGICYLVDKGFTRLFRSQSQHRSGTAVRLNKRYGSIGLILAVLGLSVLFMGLSGTWLFLACGILILLLGIGLVVYYMTFGVFYDEKSFVLTTFGKKSTTYCFGDIRGQQLYLVTGKQTVIELVLTDGRAFQLQSTMTGVYEFMDTAFAGWLAQRDMALNECNFYDPQNSCWFPKVED